MAVDMFLKLEGIKGESKAKGHEDEIDIQSFSWGCSQTGSMALGGGGGAGKVSFQDFNFSKKVDKASPELFLKCCNGKHISKGVLTVRKAGEKPLDYLVIEFEDLLVSSTTFGGAGSSDDVSENVSINFAKQKMTYREQDTKTGGEKSKTEASWNLKTGQKD